MACDFKLAGNISPNCDNPMIKGLGNTAYLINYDDIDFDSCTFDATRKNLLKTLVLKTGTRGYLVKQIRDSFTGTASTAVVGTFRTNWDNSLAFKWFDADADVNESVINLANGKFVAVVENSFKNTAKATTPGDSVFQVYGFDAGLRLATGVRDVFNADLNGGWDFLLTETGSPRPALYWFNTSLATTRAAFEAIGTAVGGH